jgi:hypothetical protein
MTDRFEEDLGKYAYITLPQVKDYLSISSNTQDARLSNIIFYATSVIEHYIGQEVAANTYVEIFDGGVSSVFVSRLPLSNVYQITEFNGFEHQILTDPSTIGVPNSTTDSALSVSFYNSAQINAKIKRFGQASLELPLGSYIGSTAVPDKFKFDEGDFTIEMFVRIDDPTIQNNTIFEINTDAANYMKFSMSNQYGLSFESNVAGVATIVRGANTLIESQQFGKRKWAHVAVSRNLENERLYLHYNGNTIANASYAIVDHTFTSNVKIGNGFKGYIDEFRVSSISRYNSNFVPPAYRFRPDSDTACLIHFDGKDKSTSAVDAHSEPNEYNFDRGTGRITRDTGNRNIGRTYRSVQRSYPSLSLVGPATFQPYPSGVRVEYRAGYEIGSVPYDLQLATLDFIKIIYKQDQEKKGFSFEGERADNFSLSSNFPPHITRVLDLYRIIK